MNMTWLEDFLTLAATGNFSRAADDRHVTQPAFGRRVRALEEWLGAELFDRSSQPVQLTEAGLWFHDTARNLLAEMHRLPGEARAMAEAASSRLRFAATHALSLTFVPDWLRRFDVYTLAGNLQLESDMLRRCETLLAQRRVQFVLCHAHAQASSPMEQAGHISMAVGHDTLLPVSAAGSGDQASRHSLDDTTAPLLAYSDESGLGHILAAACPAAQLRLAAHTVFTAHLASVLRTMALDGRGVAWLPFSLIAPDLDAGRLQPAGGPQWQVPLEIRLYRNPAPLGKTAEALWVAVGAQA
ncbi:LysR family transcriptional regulator [Corticimicrobacter populi]|uniref:LysR family transcriptional regulator n=1 Tax=Corticimicrobacter populi TaxID=2175229 RepID=A0A2V1K989_9BURK|nr:LysR family transcriptional regulator [Corticimicrobacter populi]PWF25532.1 LysR family transcriptional regulator [Corticimicrobacter populi]